MKPYLSDMSQFLFAKLESQLQLSWIDLALYSIRNNPSLSTIHPE